MIDHKKSASWVSPKWVKNNERRKREERKKERSRANKSVLIPGPTICFTLYS